MASSGATNPITKEVQFSDLSITLTPHPLTGKPTILKNANAVAGALKNLILTNKFERPYEPLYGSDIYNRLFENFDPIEQINIEQDIRAAIANYEPRVKIDDVTVIASSSSNAVEISIRFYIVNEAQPIGIRLQVERTK
jgi:phage baseplate assembly protein W